MPIFFYFAWAQAKNEILVESISQKYDYEKLFLAKEQIREPLETRIAEGKKLYDIVHIEDPCNFSISEKVYNLLIEHKATGWKSYDIDIAGIETKFHGFQVTGHCGPLIRPPQAGFVQGYKFDIETWDGSDFFYPADTFSLFCTERIRDILIAHKITNLKFHRSDLVKWYST